MNYQSFFIFFNQESCVIRTGYSNTKSSESENSGDFTAVRLTESCVLKWLDFQLINGFKDHCNQLSAQQSILTELIISKKW